MTGLVVPAATVAGLVAAGYPVMRDESHPGHAVLYSKPPGPVVALLDIDEGATGDARVALAVSHAEAPGEPLRLARARLAVDLEGMAANIGPDTASAVASALNLACLILVDPTLSVLEGVPRGKGRPLVDHLLGHRIPHTVIDSAAARSLVAAFPRARQVGARRTEITARSGGTDTVLVVCDRLDPADVLVWPSSGAPRAVQGVLRDAITDANSKSRRLRAGMLKEALSAAAQLVPPVTGRGTPRALHHAD